MTQRRYGSCALGGASSGFSDFSSSVRNATASPTSAGFCAALSRRPTSTDQQFSSASSCCLRSSAAAPPDAFPSPLVSATPANAPAPAAPYEDDGCLCASVRHADSSCTAS